MQWLPEGLQPARGLPPNRLGDYVRPEFAALYKPEALQWFPSDRYSGRPLPRTAFDWSVYPQQVTAPAYDPQKLEWAPQGRVPQIQLERRVLGDFSQPSFVSLYDPRRLEWQAEDGYYGRALQRSPFDWTAFQQPIVVQAFDPKTLDWMPRGIAPRVPVEVRKVGDFQQPAFDALYKPAGMQWWMQERYPRNAVEIRRLGTFVQPAFGALYKPELMQWLLTGLQPARTIRFIYQGSWIIDPALLASGTVPPFFPSESPVHFRARPGAVRLGEATEKLQIARLGESIEKPEAERLGSVKTKPPGEGLGS